MYTCDMYSIRSNVIPIGSWSAGTALKIWRVHLPPVFQQENVVQVDPVMVAPVVAAPMLLILLIWVLVADSKKQEKKKK